MAFSYSFHLSNKSNAVTSVGKVTQCSKHNLREYKSASYDVNSIEILAGSRASVLDDFKRIYHEEFDEALEKYNEGKRSDRQIKDYLEHVSESRADVGAEIIIQVGDQDFWNDKSMEQKKKMNYIFKDQLRSLEKLCPEFKIASAVVHYDEKSPHMHVIGIPVADGYEKGMSKQVAKTKIFTKEKLSYLQDKMRENMEKGMELNKDLFGDVQLKAKEKGRNKDIPKSSLDEFYEIQRKRDELVKEMGIASSIDIKRVKDLSKTSFLDRNKVTLEVGVYEELMKYASLGVTLYKEKQKAENIIEKAQKAAAEMKKQAEEQAKQIIDEARYNELSLETAKKEFEHEKLQKKYDCIIRQYPQLEEFAEKNFKKTHERNHNRGIER